MICRAAVVPFPVVRKRHAVLSEHPIRDPRQVGYFLGIEIAITVAQRVIQSRSRVRMFLARNVSGVLRRMKSRNVSDARRKRQSAHSETMTAPEDHLFERKRQTRLTPRPRRTSPPQGKTIRRAPKQNIDPSLTTIHPKSTEHSGCEAQKSRNAPEKPREHHFLSRFRKQFRERPHESGCAPPARPSHRGHPKVRALRVAAMRRNRRGGDPA
jgi:hypothetical protein